MVLYLSVRWRVHYIVSHSLVIIAISKNIKISILIMIQIKNLTRRFGNPILLSEHLFPESRNLEYLRSDCL